MTSDIDQTELNGWRRLCKYLGETTRSCRARLAGPLQAFGELGIAGVPTKPTSWRNGLGNI